MGERLRSGAGDMIGDLSGLPVRRRETLGKRSSGSLSAREGPDIARGVQILDRGQAIAPRRHFVPKVIAPAP